MAAEQPTQGNGMTLAVHEFRLKSQDEKLEAIFVRQNGVADMLARHDERINSLMDWRKWATGIGTGVILALLGVVLRVAGS